MYLMALICRLYGEKDFSRFSKVWMPLEYTVPISGSSFNWGGVISKKLSITIQQAQKTREGETPSFFMASFLLDVICARNVFSGMNLSWHVVELPVHVYCQDTFYYFKERLSKTFSSNQENDIQIRSLVFGIKEHLYQGFWSYWCSTFSPRLCPGPFGVGGNMLPDHFIGFQHLSSEG
jgi:hypothetical protein